jgi:methionine synthase / methylenetetrahydrofolate reductase(NADPH)
VDVIILETFADSAQLLSAVRVVKSIAPIPLIASVASGPDGTTYQGEDLRAVFLKLLASGADVVGLNCGYGIRAIETALTHIGEINAPVSAMPNAGIPERVGGRLIYGVSEEYFAGEAVHLAQMGVKIIGGCCGTTPAHIEAVAQKLREKKIIIKPRHRAAIETAVATEQFKQGQFLSSIPADTLPIICEIDPPATLKCEKRIEAIAACVKAGASAISMADNPLATIKINNLAFAALVKRTVDTNIILHVTGRDRNLLGLQSFMLGAHIVGIESLLCVTGDPSHQHGGPSNVFDTNSIGLVKMAANLNKGKNLLGKDVGQPTNFSIGVAVNPNLIDFSPQIKHLKNKISAGARFAMTQPLFEAQKIREFISATKELDIKIFIGIFPLLSSRTAEYLHNEVPGIVVPQDLRNMLSAKDDAVYQKQAGLDYTKKLLSAIRESVDGLYLIAPHAEPDILAGLVEFVKKG